jgi:GNAT superfamily N-acetyltransferase
VQIVRTDAAQEEARALLAAHEREMIERYGGGSWEGTGGRKDILWLARGDDGAPLGCVALRELAPGRVEVKHLYVTPEARRAGVASALMDALEAEARSRGAAILLETGDAQPEALSFYARRGYANRGPYDGCEFETPRSRYFQLGG